MNERARRGLILAATKRIRSGNNGWVVPSQTGDGTFYKVDPNDQRCDCPDHSTRGVKCKHIYAVEFVIQREMKPDGSVVETKAVRMTYRQDWTAYNGAQTEEKARFMVLLSDLCRGIEQPPQFNGRPRLSLPDMVFTSAFKVYSGFSSRRFGSDMQDAHDKGLLGRVPHFNSVNNYLANPSLMPVLAGLVTKSSLPLKAVETDFAVDSSGFSTSRFIRWYNKKWGRELDNREWVLDNREWVKVHAMCGVKTHVVTSVEVSGWAANDTTFFTPLVEENRKALRHQRGVSGQSLPQPQEPRDSRYTRRNRLHTVQEQHCARIG